MKILITIHLNSVAQRFDLASEVLIADHDGQKIIGRPRTIIMSRPSAEELCNLIIKEDIKTVICGGIEELHYKFLTWKKVDVLDSVIGDYSTALDLAADGTLTSGTILAFGSDNSNGSAS
jgi:predicted Fe-Mo cluster-binding NifX family protein